MKNNTFCPIYKLSLFCTLLCLYFFLGSCKNDNYTPKPTGYPRVVFPAATNYQIYNAPACPFTFETASYSRVEKDSLFFNKAPENPCWMNIKYPNLNAQLYLSYKPITKSDKNNLSRLVNDAYKMNSKHVRAADYIEDSVFTTKNGVHGVYYAVGGDAASSTQLYLTDSVQHFIWASLYFANVPNEDSIAPVVNFLRKDIDHLVNSFKWKQ